MQIHEIVKKNKNKKRARVGRGGKRGKTSGRGTKGQKARAGNKRRPEMRDIIKKLPKRRGYGKNRAKSVNALKPAIFSVSLDKINAVFNSGDTVSVKSLLKKGIVPAQDKNIQVKVLSNGTLDKVLNFDRVLYTAKSLEKIKAAGGQVV